MTSVPLWVTIVGFAAPLMALAGSATAFVINLYREAAEHRKNYFFELMQFIDSDRPMATKVAAVYELRRFPEHREFVIRFCQSQQANISGTGASLLAAEMEQTRRFMEQLPH